MKKQKDIITDDDYKLLVQLWKWKFLTTSVIHCLVYPSRRLMRCYERLNHLENKKYIETFCSRDGKNWFWQLTEKGHKVINFHGAQLLQRGFKSEHVEHDFWVNVFHLGFSLKYLNKNSSTFTEQQMRRLNVENYPDWVPHTKTHRPDGWSLIDIGSNSKKSLIAFEVELNRKASESYIDLGRFYSETVDIGQVLWFAKSEADAKYILNNLKKGSQNEANEHSFIIISQFIKQQWQAPILIGKNLGESIDFLFQTCRQPAPYNSGDQVWFDLRKKPTKSSINSLSKDSDLRVT